MRRLNECKTRYGMGHIRHHEAKSMLAMWLLTIFALTIERLYRLRYLHRAATGPLTADRVPPSSSSRDLRSASATADAG